MGNFDNVNVNVNGVADFASTLATYKTIVLKNDNIVDGHLILTQGMLSHKRTKYIIKWNFDLDGETITVPKNCIIEFDGGNISNGTLIGQDTILIYSQALEDIINNVSLEGTFIHKNGGSAADEEDITDADGTLKLADKAYAPENYSGLGRIYLRKNVIEVYDEAQWAFVRISGIVYLLYAYKDKVYAVYNNASFNGIVLSHNVVTESDSYDVDDIKDIVGDNHLSYTEDGGVYTITLPDNTTITSTALNSTEMFELRELEKVKKNVLTQDMINKANTIYHIQYDYDLDGETITVPAGCVLEFDGGSLRNGTLVGNNTILEYYNELPLNNITESGTFVDRYDFSSVAYSGSYDDLTNKPSNFVEKNNGSTRPVENLYIGMPFFDTTLDKTIYWNGTKWVDEKGFTAALSKGTTANRPTSTLTSGDVGYEYYDTDLMQPIYYGGDSKWYDVTGSEVTA